jgi:developmental checkpoint coupling sporulation initiation to replication initiation
MSNCNIDYPKEEVKHKYFFPYQYSTNLNISDELLFVSYYKAIGLKLTPDFITLLKRELSRRFNEE